MMQQKIQMLIRKELWEHKSGILTVPMIISIVMTLLVTTGIFYGLGAQISTSSGVHIFTNFQQDLLDLDQSGFPQIGQMFVSMVFSPYFFAGSLVQLFYFLSSLYDERRDRSVIFWRSLPVSDLETVSVKLLTGALVIPLIFLSMCSLSTILVSLFSTLFLYLAYGESVWHIWMQMEVGRQFMEYWISVLPYAMWLTPIYCWLMIVSIMANKAPLLWAVLPWMTLSFFERILKFTGMWPPEFLGISTRISEYYNRKASLLGYSSNSIWNTTQVLDSGFWWDSRHLIALILAIGMFLVTVWLRKYRNEAI